MKKKQKLKKQNIAEKKRLSKSVNKGFDGVKARARKNSVTAMTKVKNVSKKEKKSQQMLILKSSVSSTLTNVNSKRGYNENQLIKKAFSSNFEKLASKEKLTVSEKTEFDTYWNYKSASSSRFSVPDFLNGQKQSFKNFLTYGLIQELNLYGWFSMRLEDISSTWAFYNLEKDFIKMPLDNSIDVLFHGDHYKLTKPKLSPRKAILSRKTYSSQLYVPIQINLHWTKEVFVYWFLLANLPMMTRKGHFIINGNPRVLLSQIIRRPGIYFKKIEKNKNSIYVADIIAQRGTWLRLEIVRKKKNPSTGKIWAKLKKLKRFSVGLLLSDLGLSQAFFDHYLKSNTFLNRFKNDAIFQNTFSSKVSTMDNFLKTEIKPWLARLNSRQGYFRKKFSNAYAYSLSHSGRQHLNQTLGLNLPLNHTTLTGEDILLGCCQLIDFFNGSQKPSDIDNLKNRKLRPTGELIQSQLAVGLLQLRQNVLETLNKQTDKNGALWKNREIEHSKQRKTYFQNLISNAPVNKALKSFFATNPLSQFLDQTNALSELTHKRRISSLGEGGIQRDTATMAVRGIHPSHYGRICPIETPEGQNAGLVNSFTAYANLNALGLIETPFYTVYKGMVLKERALMFSSEQEKNFVIAPGDVSMTKDHCLCSKKETLPVRQALDFSRLLPNQINYMAVDPVQMISIATSLIPFLEHDDGNRALMGSNMQRQAVPTLIAAAPIVGTGFESRVLSDSCVGIQAKSSGFVSYVDNQKIKLYKLCLPNKSSQTLKTKFKLKRLRNEKLNLNRSDNKLLKNASSINVENPVNNPVKQVSKVNLFGYKNQINQINLSQTQLYRHLDLMHHHAYFSLWLLFSIIAKQGIVKTNAPTFFVTKKPIITKTALTLLQETYNAHYFNHYCIFLLHQMFQKENKSYSNAQLKLNNLQWSNDQHIHFIESSHQHQHQKIQKNKNFKTKLSTSPNFIKTQPQREHQRAKKKIFTLVTQIKPDNKLTCASKGFKNFNKLPEIKTKTIITPYLEGYTKDRLKAVFKEQSKLTSTIFYTANLKSLSSFFTTETLKTKLSSTLLQKNLNKIIIEDLNADSFTKPTFSTTVNQMFYMPLFEFDSKSENFYNSNSKSKLLNFNKNFHNVPRVEFNVINTSSSKALIANQYNLLPYFRSNQDTPLAQKPLVKEGQWVEKGDTLVDTSSSLNGELAIGQNLLVGYTPWEGYNFEDAVLLNQRVISDDLLTTIHIERYEINLNDTRYGAEYISEQSPSLEHNLGFDSGTEMTTKSSSSSASSWDYLDSGIIKVGTWVQEGMILVYKFTPIERQQPVISAYERLAHKVLQTSEPSVRNTSVRVPANVCGRVIHVEILEEFKEGAQVSDQTDASIENENQMLNQTFQNLNLLPKRLGFKRKNLLEKNLKFQKLCFPNSDQNFLLNLKLKTKNRSDYMDEPSFGTNVVYMQSQTAKKPQHKTESKKGLTLTLTSPETIFLDKTGIKPLNRIKVFSKLHKGPHQELKNPIKPKLRSSVKKVEIYIAEQRKVQVGDKIAGRHGNKGIISAILPREDMPYLPDGSVLDIVLNPLGVPSRMNVGQIFECLLGLAGSYLNQVYKIQPFDETYGIEASRSLVYSKLYEARLKTNQSWLFNPNYPGKVRLFDGRTGQCFAQPVTVGKAYILKLIHLVDEKIHARSTGPYSVITQQPLRGRSKQGGQRVGEMEVWAFEGFGAAYILQELLTIKSDDMENRKKVHFNILNNEPFTYGLPESFNVLVNELKCLCLNTVVGKERKLPLIKNGFKTIFQLPLRKPRKRWPFI